MDPHEGILSANEAILYDGTSQMIPFHTRRDEKCLDSDEGIRASHEEIKYIGSS